MEGPNVSKWISWVPKIYLSTLHCLKAALPPPNDQHYHPWKNSHSASCLLIPCHNELKVAGWQSQVKAQQWSCLGTRTSKPAEPRTVQQEAQTPPGAMARVRPFLLSSPGSWTYAFYLGETKFCVTVFDLEYMLHPEGRHPIFTEFLRGCLTVPSTE